MRGNFTIKLDNQKIDLTSNIFISYDNTNLPKQYFKFNTRRPIFWKLEQKHYDLASGVLTVSVIDYSLPTDTVLDEREPKYPIKNLHFEKLDWERFEPLINSYTLSRLKDSIFNFRNGFFNLNDERNEDVKYLKQSAPNLFFDKRDPVKEEREIEMKVKFEDAKFGTSKISFSIHLKPYKLIRKLDITNSNIRPEFEYIKPYFIKRLGKSFLVKVKLILLDNIIEDIIVSSEDINGINENLVNSIRIDSALNLKHFKTSREEKILYNYKELSDEDKKLSILNASAEDILEVFIEAQVKNVKQLEYLARDKQTLNDRVRFTIKPLFGFLFHVHGDKQCFIWELLDSHATYIWKNNSTENQNDLEKIVEQAIATIKNEGRIAYKKYFRSIESPTYTFGVIDHSSNNLTEHERFNEWRKKMEGFS